MGDLIKAAEAELFTAYEWAVDQLEGMEAVPEAADRLAVHEELLRVHHALAQGPGASEAHAPDRDAEAHAVAADAAAQAVANLEEEVPAHVLARLAPVRAARETLLSERDPRKQAELAGPFLSAFHSAWEEAPDGLLFDAGLAAVVQANLLPKQEGDEEGERHAACALELYETLAKILNDRLARGEQAWLETARSAVNRVVVAYRSRGEEERARLAAKRAAALPE